MKCIWHYSELHEPANILVSHLFTNDKKGFIDLVYDRSSYTLSVYVTYHVEQEILCSCRGSCDKPLAKTRIKHYLINCRPQDDFFRHRILLIFQGLTLLNLQSEHAEPVKLEFKGDYVTVWEIRLAFLVVKKPFVRCDEATKVKKVTESTGRLQEAAPRTSSDPNITPTLHTLHSLNIYLKRQPFDVVQDSFHLK